MLGHGRIIKAVRPIVVRLCLVILAAPVSAAIGCSTIGIFGSGVVETVSYDLSGFTKVNLSSAFSATINRSDTYQVELNVDANLVDYLQVIHSGDTVHIGLQPGVSLHGTLQMDAVLTMPGLEAVSLSGVSRAVIAGFADDAPFEANVSGAGSLDGDITCGTAAFFVSGTSRIELSGRGSRLTAHAGGVSTINLEQFAGGDTTAVADGTSIITVNTSNALNATVSGVSKVLYVGNPAPITTSISGVSEVRRK